MILDFIQVNKIEGYEDVKDCYWIFIGGEIVNRDTGKVLKKRLSTHGYPRYDLRTIDGKKNVKIHQILAQAFIPNPDNLPVVRHLDDNKLNYRIENLAWGTHSDNEHDKKKNTGSYSGSVADPLARAKAAAKGGKVRSKPVRCIETNVIYPSAMEVQRMTGICRSSISQCCNGKQKTAGGLEWEWYQPRQAPNNIVDMSDYLEMNTSYKIN